MCKLSNVLPKGLVGPCFELRAETVDTVLECEIGGDAPARHAGDAAQGCKRSAGLGACLSEVSGAVVRARN